MSKNGAGAIYYTDFRADPFILQTCRDQINRSFDGEIICVSLNKPLDFGTKNLVLENEERSYETMCKQILMGLKALSTDYVFFLENDVLYHKTHFDFSPLRDDVYYYNINNYRWLYYQNFLITYENLTSLSMLCCDRELATKHYQYHLDHIDKFMQFEVKSKEPKWARRLGYEPGTKPRRRGGLTDEEHVKVRSELPNIDIRHKRTFSAPKVTIESFRCPPPDFTQITIDEVPGWDLREMFNLPRTEK